MNLSNVVPWGRSFDEYRSIFSLTDADLQKRLLGCSDGPASFNAELTQRGGNVVSVDPIYQFSCDQIRTRIDAVYPQIMAQMAQNTDDYVWQSIKDVQQLGQVRMQAMLQFLSDYEAGIAAGRYRNASLPSLPFADKEFELALCSHFLFLYSDLFDLNLHIQGIRELCRVANEVRIYPLLSLDGKQSKHLPAVIDALAIDDVRSSLQRVDYQFQKGASHMLVATSV